MEEACCSVFATGAELRLLELRPVLNYSWSQEDLGRVSGLGSTLGDARRDLGWQPETSFSELVAEMVRCDF